MITRRKDDKVICMSTADTTGFGPDVTVDGHPLKNREHGKLLIAEAQTRARMMSDGTPVTDWSHIADHVDPSDLKVGDHVGTGRRSFSLVVTAPGKWRNFVRFDLHESRPGDLPQTFTVKMRPGFKVWRLRAAS